MSTKTGDCHTPVSSPLLGGEGEGRIGCTTRLPGDEQDEEKTQGERRVSLGRPDPLRMHQAWKAVNSNRLSGTREEHTETKFDVQTGINALTMQAALAKSGSSSTFRVALSTSNWSAPSKIAGCNNCNDCSQERLGIAAKDEWT